MTMALRVIDNYCLGIAETIENVNLGRKSHDIATVAQASINQARILCSVTCNGLQLVKLSSMIIEILNGFHWIRLTVEKNLSIFTVTHRIIPILGIICNSLLLFTETIHIIRQLSFYKALNYQKTLTSTDILQTLKNINQYPTITLKQILPVWLFKKFFTQKDYLNELINDLESQNPSRQEESLKLYKTLHNYNIKKITYHVLSAFNAMLGIIGFALVLTSFSNPASIILWITIIICIMQYIIYTSVVENGEGGINPLLCLPTWITRFIVQTKAEENAPID